MPAIQTKDKQITLEQAKVIWDETQDNATDIAANASAITAIQTEMASSVATMADFRTYLGIQEEQQSGESGSGE